MIESEQSYNFNMTDGVDGVRETFYLLWSWFWLIILAGLLAGTVAFLFSINTTPVYQTSTRILVSSPPATNGIDISAMVNIQTMTSTYSQMLVDRPVLQGVIDQLQLSTTADDLKKSISVNIVTNTQLVTITVKDTDPQRAADIANAMASVFTDRIRELQSQRFAASRDGLSKQVTDMEAQINNTSSQIAATTDPTSLDQLQARLTQYRTIYSNLVTNYEQVRLSEAQTSTNVIVSEPAIVPSIPISPKTSLNTVLAVIAGMLMVAGAVFAFDTLDDTIKNPDEIRRKFNLSILGMIASHGTTEEKPISLLQPRSPVAESFRGLRTNISFAGVDKPLRHILITSATPQEGKTTVSSNLAVVLSQGEKKVILIDADLRRPQIHRKFGLFNHIGLSDLFLLNRPLDSLPTGVIQVLNEKTKLSVVTSGKLPPNPSELLTSQKMGQFLTLLINEYDLILIDTPPVLSVTDAVALATRVDGVIVVAKPGVTKKRDFLQTLEQLRSVDARVLGVVLNQVNSRSRKYGYHYNRYYSKYTNYYEADEGKKKKTKR
jgi:succinoglycan biosynthesis transport protein ExoP